jgi:hypothetical protein
VVRAQLEQSDPPEVRRQVVGRELGVERLRRGFEGVLTGQPGLQVLLDVRLVRLTSVISVVTICCRAVLAADLVAKPDLLVCSRVPLLSRPYSRT